MSGNSTEQVGFIKFVINGNQTLAPTKEAVEALGKHLEDEIGNVAELVTGTWDLES